MLTENMEGRKDREGCGMNSTEECRALIDYCLFRECLWERQVSAHQHVAQWWAVSGVGCGREGAPVLTPLNIIYVP